MSFNYSGAEKPYSAKALTPKNSHTPSQNPPSPKIISLFSGAGGLDLGFFQAGYQIAVSLDSCAAAAKTHQRNFSNTVCYNEDLTKLGARGVISLVEKHVPHGSNIAVIGGPPCQGFSRANVKSAPSDPRNKLTQLYLKIVNGLQEIYDVEFIIFENVLGIKDKKHAEVFDALLKGIKKSKFDITEKELSALDFGVPQNRRRVIIMGIANKFKNPTIKITTKRGIKCVKDVLQGLAEPAFFSRSIKSSEIPLHPNHWTMKPKSKKFLNPASLETSGRSFRKLHWNEPSPTVAYGHREIHVHPKGHRRLSIFEAMLLQGFPTEYVLEGNLSQQVQQVSNAVPPPMARHVALAVKRATRIE